MCLMRKKVIGRKRSKTLREVKLLKNISKFISKEFSRDKSHAKGSLSLT